MNIVKSHVIFSNLINLFINEEILTWFSEDKAAIINHFLSEVSLWFSIYYCPDNLVRVHL